MPLSDSELKALKADAKRKVVSAGDSLFVVIESVGKGGGKSFLGITRFPPGGGGKRVKVRIGPYGKSLLPPLQQDSYHLVVGAALNGLQ